MTDSTVFIVDDDPDVRSSLSRLVTTAGMATRTFGSAEEFLQSSKPSGHGCLLVDVRMPGMGGLELLERLSESGSHFAAIVLTGYGDVRMAVRAMKAGATDFIEKPFRAAVLLDRIGQAVAQAEGAYQARQERQALRERFAQLSPREHEVMKLLAEGLSVKEIAYRLELAYGTVDNQKTSLMRKLDVHTTVELVRLAIRAGVVSA
jgi:RNA polymerase sigma factor (sigma-70 family)